MSALYLTWYKPYSFGGFHFFDDGREWQMSDKLGHFTTAYSLTSFTWQLFENSPSSLRRNISTLIPLIFLTNIEIFDGFSKGWGFSVWDFGANVSGSALFLLQQNLWDEQYLIPKFSFHSTTYAKHRPELLGSNSAERILKDYNGQTYWLSIPLYVTGLNLPPWLCVSLGYNASGMLGARSNNWTKDGFNFDYSHIPRTSTGLLSLDIDLMKLPFKGRSWKLLSSGLRWVKIPLPALAWSNQHGWNFHGIYR